MIMYLSDSIVREAYMLLFFNLLNVYVLVYLYCARGI